MRGEFKMGKIVKWLEAIENKKFQREMKMNQVAELDAKSMQAYINKIWGQFDTDRSGELDRKEAKAFLQYAMDDLMKNKFGETQIGDDEFDTVFDIFDKDQSGTIDKKEMIGFIRNFF